MGIITKYRMMKDIQQYTTISMKVQLVRNPKFTRMSYYQFRIHRYTNPNPPNPSPHKSKPKKKTMKNFQHLVLLVPADPSRHMKYIVDSMGQRQARIMMPTLTWTQQALPSLTMKQQIMQAASPYIESNPKTTEKMKDGQKEVPFMMTDPDFMQRSSLIQLTGACRMELMQLFIKFSLYEFALNINF